MARMTIAQLSAENAALRTQLSIITAQLEAQRAAPLAPAQGALFTGSYPECATWLKANLAKGRYIQRRGESFAVLAKH